MAVNSVILPNNKSKELCNQTINGTGTQSLKIAVEQGAAAFTFHLTSTASPFLATFKMYHVGDHDDDKVLIHTSPSFTQAAQTPYSFEVDVAGPLLFEITTDNTITYTLRGKALTSRTVGTQTVALSNESTELKNWRADVKQLLQQNNELLDKVVNHLRVMTDINPDEGEEF